MSKERARRRAEREAVAARERQQRERSRVRRDRRSALVAPSPPPFRRANRPKVDSALTRSRQRQNGGLLAVLLPAHVALWLLTPSWLIRGSALVLTLLLWPLLTVLIFDRRPTR